ncbi:MAG TPA: hypothetical protein PK653_05990 [Syntrophales bacterium]|jgi:hypothetical protein|nr:hypothetical protein [Syntrophales bacterium]
MKKPAPPGIIHARSNHPLYETGKEIKKRFPALVIATGSVLC